MDALGVDVQVIYPTVFLRPITNRPAAERAICRSYNRWLGDIWTEGQGRLRWAAVLPLLDMDAALAELRWAREHGACAVFIRGLEDDKRIDGPVLLPPVRGRPGPRPTDRHPLRHRSHPAPRLLRR